MLLPTIAIINFSKKRSDQDVQDAIRAVNRQIVEDFLPLWGCGRMLRLHEASIEPDEAPHSERVRADSVIYLVDESTLPGALGYHDINTAEIPVGFVFTGNNDWTITLSHEVLELIVDPNASLFLPGPHPTEGRTVWHSYEVCDAVERSSYTIDDIPVSNFVTPEYFVAGDSNGTRNDFLGVGVRSFGVTEDSHLGIFDPATGGFETILGKSKVPRHRAAARRAAEFAREKPARPTDDQLAGILAQARRQPKLVKAGGLATLGGITRLSRYKSASHALFAPAAADRAAG